MPQYSLKQSTRRRLFVVLLLLLFPFAVSMSGCVTGPTGQPGSLPPTTTAPPVDDVGRDALRLSTEGKYAEAAARWQFYADTTTNPQRRQDYLLNAAEQFLLAGDRHQAAAALGSVELGLLQPAQEQREKILLADLLLREGRPLELLAILPVSPNSLSEPLAQRFFDLRGRAKLQTGALVSGLQDLNLGETYLNTTEEIQANHVVIWSELINAEQAELQQALRQSADPVIRGWFELAIIGKEEWLAPRQFVPRLEQWRIRHATHPALFGLYARLEDEHRQRETWPASVALLLPMTGRFSAVGQAIRDGFLAAYYAGEESGALTLSGRPPEIRVYDVGNEPATVVARYQEAVANGANFVVGPLRKEAVEILHQQPLPVPVLSLNYLDTPLQTENLYQFGLSPEGEAKEVARQAARLGYRNALGLFPQGDWGQRVGAAFETVLRERGGDLRGRRSYQARANDHGEEVESLLLLDGSENRRRRLEKLFGAKLESVPRRRQDGDFIFLAARPGQARILRPELKFHRAGDIPVVGISHLYSGEPAANDDRDLNGVFFVDMPWILDNDGPNAAVREVVKREWPKLASRHSRLFALGFDAYRLLPLLANADSGSLPWIYAGATGRLSVNQQQQIERSLRLARFVEGVPRPYEISEE